MVASGKGIGKFVSMMFIAVKGSSVFRHLFRKALDSKVGATNCLICKSWLIRKDGYIGCATECACGGGPMY